MYKAIAQIVNNNRRTEIYFATHNIPARDRYTGSETSISWINACIAQVGDIQESAVTISMILSNNQQLLDE